MKKIKQEPSKNAESPDPVFAVMMLPADAGGTGN